MRLDNYKAPRSRDRVNSWTACTTLFAHPAFHRDQGHFALRHSIEINQYSGIADLRARRNYMSSASFLTTGVTLSRSCAVQQPQERKNSRRVTYVAEYSGSTSWYSTRFIGSTQTSRHSRTPMCTSCALVCSRTPGIDVYEGSMTQEPNSSHSLAPLGYPSDPKNHRESSSSLSFLERVVLTLSSPIQPLSALFSFSLALSLLLSFSLLLAALQHPSGRRISFFGNAEGSGRTGN